MSTENNQTIVPYSLNDQEIQDLNTALDKLEAGQGVLLRLADIMGGAVGQVIKLSERGLNFTPKIQKKIEQVTNASIRHAFEISILGLNCIQHEDEYAAELTNVWRDRVMKAMVATSGAIGGFTGLVGMLPDISFTTLALMREIAHIAREEGEDLKDEDTKKACLEVFALRTFINKGVEDKQLGFFSARLMLRGRPMVLLMTDVSYQYGLSLSQKLSMQMMPVVSALCGASLNIAFLNHYRSLARLHFVIRRLEREHGALAKKTIEYICKNHAKSSQFF